VNVITPGWIVALDAGAHAAATGAAKSELSASTPAMAANLQDSFIDCFSFDRARRWRAPAAPRS
jgi:hypothetical protein